MSDCGPHCLQGLPRFTSPMFAWPLELYIISWPCLRSVKPLAKRQHTVARADSVEQRPDQVVVQALSRTPTSMNYNNVIQGLQRAQRALVMSFKDALSGDPAVCCWLSSIYCGRIRGDNLMQNNTSAQAKAYSQSPRDFGSIRPPCISHEGQRYQTPRWTQDVALPRSWSSACLSSIYQAKLWFSQDSKRYSRPTSGV